MTLTKISQWQMNANNLTVQQMETCKDRKEEGRGKNHLADGDAHRRVHGDFPRDVKADQSGQAPKSGSSEEGFLKEGETVLLPWWYQLPSIFLT